jgi:hypothetical protein
MGSEPWVRDAINKLDAAAYALQRSVQYLRTTAPPWDGASHMIMNAKKTIAVAEVELTAARTAWRRAVAEEDVRRQAGQEQLEDDELRNEDPRWYEPHAPGSLLPEGP